MYQTRNCIDSSLPATDKISVNGKITNFSCDKLVFAFSASGAVTGDDLAKVICRVQLKNSKGANAICVNSVPAKILAKLSDFMGGWGVNADDKYGAFAVDLGNVVLEGDDELDIVVTAEGLSQAYALTVFGVDQIVGAERIMLYDFIDASATQTYQQVDACSVYLSLADSAVPSSKSISVNDYFGRNIITQNEAIATGAVMAHSGDVDNFGPIWMDSTGLTQDMSFKASDDAEEYLVVRRFFDSSRIGMGQQSVIDFANYLAYIKRVNPSKYQCLEYTRKLDGSI